MALTSLLLIYSYAQRHGSEDDALCAPYSGTDCCALFLLMFYSDSNSLIGNFIWGKTLNIIGVEKVS